MPDSASAARRTLAEHLISEPADEKSKQEAMSEVRTAVTAGIEREFDDHAALINERYATERTEVLMLNKSSDKAAGKMDQIIGKVATSLGELRAESLALLN